MGILNWIRALLSREAVHCDVCRERIRPSEFARGLAVVVARKKFCRHCVDYVTGRQERTRLRPTLEISSSATPLHG